MKLTLVLRAVVLSATAFALAACAASPGGSSSSSFSFSSLSAATPPSAASHLYTQTNETSNKIIHYARNADGTLVEVERVATGGKGTNGYKILTRQKSAPDNLVSVGPVILSADNSMLFAVNASDSSVSSFSVGQDGKLQLRDRQPTGQKAPPTSLAYIAKAGMLYVMHSTGPNHIRSFKVADGKLRLMRKKYTLNTPRLQNRVGTQIISSPDERFLLANVVFNTPPPKVTPSNAKTKDGLLVFPIRDDGSLGKAVVNDAGGEGPFGLAFLNGSDNVFVNTLADSSGAVLSTLGPDGKVTSTPIARVALNPANKGPADTCWVSLSPGQPLRVCHQLQLRQRHRLQHRRRQDQRGRRQPGLCARRRQLQDRHRPCHQRAGRFVGQPGRLLLPALSQRAAARGLQDGRAAAA